MAKWKYIRNDTYKRGITVFMGSVEDFVHFLENSSYKNDEELIKLARGFKQRRAQATCYNVTDGQCIIYLPKFPVTPEEVAILGHEVLHATFFFLSYCGIKYTEESEEAYTYLYEFLLAKALTEKGYKDVE